MKRIKSAVIAFSMYSRIPMPQCEWNDEDMQYVMAFFPLVGVFIGAVTYIWTIFCSYFQVSQICFATIGTAIPLMISGGIHIDGFMDTMDAFHSYQDKEKKIAILKDPHIGAFSVIKVILYFLIYVGAYSQLIHKRAFVLVAIGFYLSRILSGICVVTFPCAKHEGLLFLFSSAAKEKAVKAVLYIQLIVCIICTIWISRIVGASIILAAFIWLFAYWKKCNELLGGITGDTAGYFLSICEAVIVVIVAIFELTGFFK